MKPSEEAIDRLETLITGWGGSPIRTGVGLSLASDVGVTAISASYADPSQSPFGVRCTVVRASTNLSPQVAPYFARLAPLLNRFAMFGAVTQDPDGLSIVSRITLTEDEDRGDDKLVLLGAAALWNVETVIGVAEHVTRTDAVPSEAGQLLSAWSEGDLEAVAAKLRDRPEFVVRVESDSLSVAFQSAGHRVLIQVFLSTPHPTLGSGLLIGLEIISDAIVTRARDELVATLNYEEALPRPSLDHLGAWCLGRFDNSVGYVSFIPNFFKDAVAPPNIEQRFVFNAINRGVLTTQRI